VRGGRQRSAFPTKEMQFGVFKRRLGVFEKVEVMCPVSLLKEISPASLISTPALQSSAMM
jgi:hypothetical protein